MCHTLHGQNWEAVNLPLILSKKKMPLKKKRETKKQINYRKFKVDCTRDPEQERREKLR